jgi:phage tail tape-measure protein
MSVLDLLHLARSKQSGQFVQWRTTSSRESENATTSEAASSLGGSEAGAGGGTHENPVGNAINSIFNLFG